MHLAFYPDRLAFVLDGATRSRTDSRPNGHWLWLGHLVNLNPNHFGLCPTSPFLKTPTIIKKTFLVEGNYKCSRRAYMPKRRYMCQRWICASTTSQHPVANVESNHSLRPSTAFGSFQLITETLSKQLFSELISESHKPALLRANFRKFSEDHF